MKNMKNMFMVFTYFLFVIPKGFGHGGVEALIAENLMLKQQLFLLTRSRKRALSLLYIHPVWSKNSSSLAVSEKLKYFNGDECIEGTGMALQRFLRSVGLVGCKIHGHQ